LIRKIDLQNQTTSVKDESVMIVKSHDRKKQNRPALFDADQLLITKKYHR